MLSQEIKRLESNLNGVDAIFQPQSDELDFIAKCKSFFELYLLPLMVAGLILFFISSVIVHTFIIFLLAMIGSSALLVLFPLISAFYAFKHDYPMQGVLQLLLCLMIVGISVVVFLFPPAAATLLLISFIGALIVTLSEATRQYLVSWNALKNTVLKVSRSRHVVNIMALALVASVLMVSCIALIAGLTFVISFLPGIIAAAFLIVAAIQIINMISLNRALKRVIAVDQKEEELIPKVIFVESSLSILEISAYLLLCLGGILLLTGLSFFAPVVLTCFSAAMTMFFLLTVLRNYFPTDTLMKIFNNTCKPCCCNDDSLTDVMQEHTQELELEQKQDSQEQQHQSHHSRSSSTVMMKVLLMNYNSNSHSHRNDELNLAESIENNDNELTQVQKDNLAPVHSTLERINEEDEGNGNIAIGEDKGNYNDSEDFPGNKKDLKTCKDPTKTSPTSTDKTEVIDESNNSLPQLTNCNSAHL